LYFEKNFTYVYFSRIKSINFEKNEHLHEKMTPFTKRTNEKVIQIF